MLILAITASGQPIIVTTVIPVGPEATRMTCPSCHSEIDSAIRKEPGLIAWISGGVLLLLGYIVF